MDSKTNSPCVAARNASDTFSRRVKPMGFYSENTQYMLHVRLIYKSAATRRKKRSRRSAPHQSPAGLLFIFNTKNNHNHIIRKHRNINATLRLPARTPADESPAAANGKEERVSTQPARAGRGGGGARAVTASSSSSHRLFCCVNVLNYVVVASCGPTWVQETTSQCGNAYRDQKIFILIYRYNM